MTTTHAICGLLAGVAIVIMTIATPASAQNIPQVNPSLHLDAPTIPFNAPLSASELTIQAMPQGVGSFGYQVAPGVIVDRLIAPRCIFIANQATGGFSQQIAAIGAVQFVCR